MQTFIQNWKQLPFRNYTYLSLGLSFFVIVIILILKGSLPPDVPLFYGKPVGEEQLIGSIGLLIAPATSLLILVVNTSLATLIGDQFIKKALVVSSLFISLLVAITVTRIVMLVGFF